MVGIVNSHHGAMVTSRSHSSPSPESFYSKSQLFPASLFTLFLIFQSSVHYTSLLIFRHITEGTHSGTELEDRFQIFRSGSIGTTG